MEGPHLTPSPRVGLFRIGFKSLEPVVVSLMVQVSPIETRPTVDVLEDDDEGWTLATRQKPRKQKQN